MSIFFLFLKAFLILFVLYFVSIPLHEIGHYLAGLIVSLKPRIPVVCLFRIPSGGSDCEWGYVDSKDGVWTFPAKWKKMLFWADLFVNVAGGLFAAIILITISLFLGDFFFVAIILAVLQVIVSVVEGLKTKKDEKGIEFL